MHSVESHEFFNSIFVLPSEILAIIISDVYPEVNKTLGRLMMVSKSLTRKIFSSLGYIKKSVIASHKLVKHLTGLINIFIPGTNRTLYPDRLFSLSSFDKRVFSNLEILTIPYCMVEELNTSEYLDEYLKSILQPRDILLDNNNSVLDNFRFDESHILTFRMPKLHTIRVVQSNDEMSGSTIINPLVIPNVSSILLEGCIIQNLSDFRNLRYLDIERCWRRLEFINGLDIEVLTIRRSTTQEILIIPSLRILTIDRCREEIDISGCSNLEKLFIERSKKVIVGIMSRLEYIFVLSSAISSKIVTNNKSPEFVNILFPSLMNSTSINCPVIGLESDRVLKINKIYYSVTGKNGSVEYKGLNLIMTS